MRATPTEEKKAGAVDVFFGGDLNIEFSLDNTDGDLQGLDRIEWYGVYGPECTGGGEDTIAYEVIDLVTTVERLLTAPWQAPGRIMKTTASSTRGELEDQGPAKNSSTTSWAQKTYARRPGITSL